MVCPDPSMGCLASTGSTLSSNDMLLKTTGVPAFEVVSLYFIDMINTGTVIRKHRSKVNCCWTIRTCCAAWSLSCADVKRHLRPDLPGHSAGGGRGGAGCV